MLTERGTIEEVLSCIDSEELAPLAMDVVSIPTPTGSAGEVAKFIEGCLKKQGIEAFRQEIERDRYKVIGTLSGKGCGPTLIFNGQNGHSASQG